MILYLVVKHPTYFQGHTELMLCVFISCHLLGMSSACLNPILYGYLNEAFRQEFYKLIKQIRGLFVIRRPARKASGEQRASLLVTAQRGERETKSVAVRNVALEPRIP